MNQESCSTKAPVESHCSSAASLTPPMKLQPGVRRPSRPVTSIKHSGPSFIFHESLTEQLLLFYEPGCYLVSHEPEIQRVFKPLRSGSHLPPLSLPKAPGSPAHHLTPRAPQPKQRCPPTTHHPQTPPRQHRTQAPAHPGARRHPSRTAADPRRPPLPPSASTRQHPRRAGRRAPHQRRPSSRPLRSSAGTRHTTAQVPPRHHQPRTGPRHHQAAETCPRRHAPRRRRCRSR